MAVDPDAATSSGSPSEADKSRAVKNAVVAVALAVAVLTALVATAYVGTGAIPGLPLPEPDVRFGLPALRVLLDLAAVGTIGLSLLPKLLGSARPKQVEPVLSRTRRVSVITALAWMCFALASLLLQVRELAPGSALTTTAVVDYVVSVPAGLGLVVSAGAALVSAALGLAALTYGETIPAELRTVVALLGVLPMPLTGHATDWEYHQFSMLSIELHVVAAALWAGGLAALLFFVAPRRGLLAVALPRFSKLATAALATVAVTGAFNGLMQLAITPGVGLAGLLTTGYGQLVLLKTACLVAVALLGAQVRFRLLPRVERHQNSALLTWAAAEIVVMAVAYGLGAVLARSPVA
ncbi:copper resistance D family protein [Saccharopolyspora erythraea]|uniref:CopD family protein n=2 Tax=Saccharopolyspora erythraea TaxID=1836 RepID=A0ABP3P5Y9_SACER|nr:CopD family protein [Saccharopolyspora erythraea]EQD84258.1 copper resistance protein CopD [Saccharopolyspora erythraea D]QRK90653.1 CopD family protein [Saccharopolyspora erythraea]CAM00019.1 probable copper resistance transporter [Saccharopolyspora erythraea NRRL 2338]